MSPYLLLLLPDCKRGVIICNKRIKFNGKIVKLVAEGSMQCLFAVPKPLSITARCFPLTPRFGYFNATNPIDNISQCAALRFISNLPIKNMLDLFVAYSCNHLCHRKRADIAPICHNSSKNGADIFCCSPLSPGCRKKPVSYTHLRAHETRHDLVCRLL